MRTGHRNSQQNPSISDIGSTDHFNSFERRLPSEQQGDEAFSSWKSGSAFGGKVRAQ